jgi:hypothetical protein
MNIRKAQNMKEKMKDSKKSVGNRGDENKIKYEGTL